MPRARGTRRRSLIATAVLAVSTVAAPSVGAQVGSPGNFSISPSRRDLVGRPPATLIPTRVGNTTQQIYDVRAFPVLLRQDLSGAFQFDETARPLNMARMILNVSPSHFRLTPGQSREVALRWELLPLSARAAHVGVIFQGQARLKGGTSVPVISRLLSINFLRLPGQYHPSGRFSALHAIQFAPQVLRLLPRVRNTGDVVGTPERGRLAITDASGSTVYKTSWPGDVILPGVERDFTVDVHKILPAGLYTAHAVMTFGATHRAIISTAFRLVGPNQLTAPGLAVSNFAATGEVGRSAHVSARVVSTGTTPASLDLTVSLFRVLGGQAEANPLASARVRETALTPGSARVIGVDLTKKLSSGQYHVLAQYTDPAGTPQQLTSDFAATRHRSLVGRVRLYFDRHRLVIIGLIGLVAVSGLVLLLLRRQRHLQAEVQRLKAERDP